MGQGQVVFYPEAVPSRSAFVSANLRQVFYERDIGRPARFLSVLKYYLSPAILFGRR
jgi:hypothetical protein